LVVIAIIAILAGLLLPALASARAKAQGTFCVHNTRQLTLAWHMYADENGGRLAYNLGGKGPRGVAQQTKLNWVDDVLDWELSPDNTNTANITEASLGPYSSKAVGIYRCPSDTALSALQRQAGWSARVRSYSMNAMMGDAGDVSASGVNNNNPSYVQFFSVASIPQPSGLFVFLDEHPESIDDGYFINNAEDYKWIDLPASYHSGAGSFSFADGHSEIHRWRDPSTLAPARPDPKLLPKDIPADEHEDFDWVTDRMSVERPVPAPKW
jgi:prepilin-type processing-associated H-X9-DG protein